MSCPGVTDAVCLVTGAAGGIGEAVARLFAEQGAKVAVVDANAGDAERIAGDLRASNACALAAGADVRDGVAVDALVERIERELGALDILVNCAGVLYPGDVVSLDERHWSEMLAVNATGVFLVSRAVARRMLPRRRGVIVTIGSNAAGVPRMDMAGYAASKAAAVHFTKCLGLELASSGIRCNVVSPGSTDTPMQRSLWTDDSARERVVRGSLEKYRVGIPLGRLARPRDVAEAVMFLASDRASHVTMHDFYVDGGATLRA